MYNRLFVTFLRHLLQNIILETTVPAQPDEQEEGKEEDEEEGEGEEEEGGEPLVQSSVSSPTFSSSSSSTSSSSDSSSSQASTPSADGSRRREPLEASSGGDGDGGGQEHIATTQELADDEINIPTVDAENSAYREYDVSFQQHHSKKINPTATVEPIDRTAVGMEQIDPHRMGLFEEEGEEEGQAGHFLGLKASQVRSRGECVERWLFINLRGCGSNEPNKQFSFLYGQGTMRIHKLITYALSHWLTVKRNIYLSWKWVDLDFDERLKRLQVKILRCLPKKIIVKGKL